MENRGDDLAPIKIVLKTCIEKIGRGNIWSENKLANKNENGKSQRKNNVK